LALTLAISGCIGTGGIAPQGKALEADSLVTDEAIQSAAQDAHWPTAVVAGVWRPATESLDRPRRARQSDHGHGRREGASGQIHGGLAESAESLQINGESTLKRHNWPTDQFYGPGTWPTPPLGQQRRIGFQLRPRPLGP
jgi:hypothetical protein